MGLIGDIQREFIARPDQFKERIVFKWPDENIRTQTRLTVEADEKAVFFRAGQVAGVLGPGVSVLDSSEVPFLGDLVDALTGGSFLRSELYFVSTREFPNLPFGGAVDNVRDPETGLGVGLRVFGDYSLQVTDPALLVTKLVGTQDLGDNDQVTDWAREQLTKAFRTVLVTRMANDAWPVMGLAARTGQIEAETLAAAQQVVGQYGVGIARLGNFTVTIKPEDETVLKRFLAQVQYAKLAGGLREAATAEALEGLGEGAAKGGAAAGAGALAMGLAAGGLVANNQQQAAAVACAACGASNPATSKFCGQCGAALGGPAPPT